MKLIISIIGLLYCIQISCGQQTNKRIVCYYDSESSQRQGYAQLTENYLKKAFPNCTHLMYGYASLNPKTYQLSLVKVTLNPRSLKDEFPHLKIYLSWGGDRDNDKVNSEKYINFLEAGKLKYKPFIESSKKLLKTHNFDGLDLAFQFLRNKPRKVHSSAEKLWKNVKKIFTCDFVVDPNADKHKHQYTEFVKDLKKAYVKEDLSLTMTVLPNVNSTWYFDIPKIQDNFEFINLFAFDFLTPARNPDEADFTAPIYSKNEQNRLSHYNIDYQVEHWNRNGCPVNKLNLGIATYGRAWKLTTESGLSGVPIVESTNGPAEQGNQTQKPGLLSYPVICLKLSKFQLTKVSDKEHKYGNYAFHPAAIDGKNGIWISFDDPEFAAIKADYVISKRMGGVALYDLSYDDFRSNCMGDAFPILRSVREKLAKL